MSDSLLPPNATKLERALERTISDELQIDLSSVRSLWDYESCSPALLPWLAWAMSVDHWDDSWDDATKRTVVGSAAEVHRQKGTLAAVRTALKSVWSDVTIREWFEYGGSPYRFRVDLTANVDDSGYHSDLASRIIRYAKASKPARSRLEQLTILLRSQDVAAYTAAALCVSHVSTFQTGPFNPIVAVGSYGLRPMNDVVPDIGVVIRRSDGARREFMFGGFGLDLVAIQEWLGGLIGYLIEDCCQNDPAVLSCCGSVKEAR